MKKQTIRKSIVPDFFYSFFDGACSEFDKAHDLFSDQVVIDNSFGKSIGRDSIAAINSHWMQAFPDLQGSAEFIVDGNFVVANYKGWGTHYGSFMNNQATGKRIQCSGIMIFETDGNKVINYKNSADLLGIYNQLGVTANAMPLPTMSQLITKDRATLLQKIRTFTRHSASLSKREAEVLSFWVNGRSARDIGAFFNLSYRTVQGYLANIMLKLDCNSKISLLSVVMDHQALHLFREFYDLCVHYNET